MSFMNKSIVYKIDLRHKEKNSKIKFKIKVWMIQFKIKFNVDKAYSNLLVLLMIYLKCKIQ